MIDNEEYADELPRIENEFAHLEESSGNIARAIERYSKVTTGYPRTEEAAYAYAQIGHIYFSHYQDYLYAQAYYDRALRESTKMTGRTSVEQRVDILASYRNGKRDMARIVFQLEFLSGDSTAIERAREFEVSQERALEEVFTERKTGHHPVFSTDSVEIEDKEKNEQNSESTEPHPFALMPGLFPEKEMKDTSEMKDKWPMGLLEEKGFPDTGKRGRHEEKESVPKPSDPKIQFGTKDSTTLMIELVRSLYRMAEMFRYGLNRPDSASAYFRQIIEDHPTFALAPRAILSLGLLYEEVYLDSIAASRYYNDVINRFALYPESTEALRRLNPGRESDIELQDSSELHFQAAERAFWREADVYRAIDILGMVERENPETDVAARAAYAIAKIYDTGNISLQECLRAYRRVIDRYPGSDYADRARADVARLERLMERDETQLREEAPTDSAEAAHRRP